MHISSDLIHQAIHKSARGHARKKEVREMLSDIDGYTLDVFASIESGSYASRLSYHEFCTTNSNGKVRHIEQPSLFTRVLQHLSMLILKPLYDRKDPRISYNCKDGYGIHAGTPQKSLSHFLKHNVYHRRDLHYALVIDQRKCYDHMARKLYRKSLKFLTDDSEIIDFAVNVAFHGNSFPIGTPTSPFAHHVIMLAFDRWLGYDRQGTLLYQGQHIPSQKQRTEIGKRGRIPVPDCDIRPGPGQVSGIAGRPPLGWCLRGPVLDIRLFGAPGPSEILLLGISSPGQNSRY